MGNYRETCEKCGDSYETEGWSPEQCPFCELAELKNRLNAEPMAWMRKWAFDGEKEYKIKSPETGRMVWHPKFKFLPVGKAKCLPDDIPLYIK